MQIPGTYSLTGKGTIPESLLLLTGPVGAGKTIYCRQFIIDGLLDGDYCIYVSSSLTDKQFRTHFSNVENLNLYKNCKFINPYLCKGHLDNRDLSSITGLEKSEGSDNKLLLTLAEIQTAITQINKLAANEPHDTSAKDNDQDLASSLGNGGIRVVVDSLTQLLTVFEESAVLKFVNDLSFLLKDVGAMAIFTLTSPSPNKYLINGLSSILDGVIEMNTEVHHNSLARSIRLLSIKAMNHKPSWVYFNIADDGSLFHRDWVTIRSNKCKFFLYRHCKPFRSFVIR
jgi:KaiC/GvpD/RAD55 family RecA-like ATPase